MLIVVYLFFAQMTFWFFILCLDVFSEVSKGSCIVTLLSGLRVLAIVIKTGTTADDESDCRAVMEICDNLANCCITSPDRQGLDNPGDDRERGQTDVYTSRSVLNSCAQEVTFLLLF